MWAVAGSSFRFSNSNYDNDNTNSNVSSRLCNHLALQTLPAAQKKTNEKRRWYSKGKRLFKAKA